MAITHPVQTMIIDKLIIKPDEIVDNKGAILLVYSDNLKIKIQQHDIIVDDNGSIESISYKDINYLNSIIEKYIMARNQ